MRYYYDNHPSSMSKCIGISWNHDIRKIMPEYKWLYTGNCYYMCIELKVYGVIDISKLLKDHWLYYSLTQLNLHLTWTERWNSFTIGEMLVLDGYSNVVVSLQYIIWRSYLYNAFWNKKRKRNLDTLCCMFMSTRSIPVSD